MFHSGSEQPLLTRKFQRTDRLFCGVFEPHKTYARHLTSDDADYSTSHQLPWHRCRLTTT